MISNLQVKFCHTASTPKMYNSCGQNYHSHYHYCYYQNINTGV